MVDEPWLFVSGLLHESDCPTLPGSVAFSRATLLKRAPKLALQAARHLFGLDAVRRGDWKYLKVADQEFLFDLAYDPRERGNLFRTKLALLDELRATTKENACEPRYRCL